MDKSLIINKIIEHYNFKSDAGFARFLGISPQVVGKWKSRNSFDIELLYTKCPDISPDWLLTGEGPMLRVDVPGGVSVNNSGISHVSHSNLGNINNKGGSVSVGADGSGLDRMIEQQKGLIESLKASQEQLSNSQRQIDKLIAIISEKLK